MYRYINICVCKQPVIVSIMCINHISVIFYYFAEGESSPFGKSVLCMCSVLYIVHM